MYVKEHIITRGRYVKEHIITRGRYVKEHIITGGRYMKEDNYNHVWKTPLGTEGEVTN